MGAIEGLAQPVAGFDANSEPPPGGRKIRVGPGRNVEKVLPHLVGENDQGIKTVNYTLELQMHMLQAIKELKSENDALRDDLAFERLQRDMDRADLVARLAELESGR